MHHRPARLVEIVNTAVVLKRNGHFEAAIDAYRQALLIDPSEVMCYYGMAKVFYLMKEQQMSLKCYTIAQHLSLINSQEAALLLPYLPMSTPAFHVPHALFSRVIGRHRLAKYMLPDGNTPRHTGHALLDLSSAGNIDEKYVEKYRRSLLGQYEDLQDAKEKTYYLRGLEYLLDNILWEQVDSCPKEEVAQQYGFL